MMLTEKKAQELCKEKLIAIMGKDYVDKHNGRICLANGSFNESEYQFFAGFNDVNENNESYRGWTVYVLMIINLKTSKLEWCQYGLPAQT